MQLLNVKMMMGSRGREGVIVFKPTLALNCVFVSNQSPAVPSV